LQKLLQDQELNNQSILNQTKILQWKVSNHQTSLSLESNLRQELVRKLQQSERGSEELMLKVLQQSWKRSSISIIKSQHNTQSSTSSSNSYNSSKGGRGSSGGSMRKSFQSKTNSISKNISDIFVHGQKHRQAGSASATKHDHQIHDDDNNTNANCNDLRSSRNSFQMINSNSVTEDCDEIDEKEAEKDDRMDEDEVEQTVTAAAGRWNKLRKLVMTGEFRAFFN
jgi:hypothetical protein